MSKITEEKDAITSILDYFEEQDYDFKIKGGESPLANFKTKGVETALARELPLCPPSHREEKRGGVGDPGQPGAKIKEPPATNLDGIDGKFTLREVFQY